MEKLLRIVACMFLVRMHYWDEHQDYARAGAYHTAYTLIVYALRDCEDWIAQFDFYEEAAQLVFEHPYCDPWDYEEMMPEFLK